MKETCLSLAPRFTIRSEKFGGLLFDHETWYIYKVNHTGFVVLKILENRVYSKKNYS